MNDPKGMLKKLEFAAARELDGVSIADAKRELRESQKRVIIKENGHPWPPFMVTAMLVDLEDFDAWREAHPDWATADLEQLSEGLTLYDKASAAKYFKLEMSLLDDLLASGDLEPCKDLSLPYIPLTSILMCTLKRRAASTWPPDVKSGL